MRERRSHERANRVSIATSFFLYQVPTSSMQADALSADPFSTDWLAMAAASDEPSLVDCTASSNDPLAFLDNAALDSRVLQGEGEQGGKAGRSADAADLTAWLGEYSASLNGGLGGGNNNPPSAYGQSDMDASPFALSETSFSAASSSLGYSNGTDLSSLFDPSSPFSSGSLFASGAAASFASDFDPNALQALFAPLPGQTDNLELAGGATGSQSAAGSVQGIPLQAVSPASTTAAAAGSSSGFSPQAPPPPYLSPSNTATTDFGLGLSPPLISTATSPSYGVTVPPTLSRSGVAVTSEQRPFTSLAAATGVVVPPVVGAGAGAGASAGKSSTVSHAYAGQASLAISQEANTAAQLARTQGGASTRGGGRQAIQPRVAVRPIAPNPAGMIANAGLTQKIHAPGARLFSVAKSMYLAFLEY